MAVIYMDPVHGVDTLSGTSIVRLTGCSVTNNSTTLTVPNNAGLSVGMVVLSGDLNNSGGLIAYQTTISAINLNTITLNKVATGTSGNATIVFSSAIKTLSGISGKVGPGDTVRIKKSPDPVSVGQNVDWTIGATSVTLATPVNLTLNDCDAAWNPSSQIAAYSSVVGLTSTPSSSSSHARWSVIRANDAEAQGENSLFFGLRCYQNGIAQATYDAFKTATDGTYTVFYFDLGQTIDLTNYQQISLWAANDFTTGSRGNIKLCLCSDQFGTVVENSFTIPNRGWSALVLDNGAPLSSQVRSISIRIENRVGPSYTGNGFVFDTLGLRLDNIVACKARGAADEITHLTLIGKNPSLSNTEQWYAVRSIESGKINIDSFSKSSPAVVRGYYNGTATSGSGPLYKRECFNIVSAGVVTPQASKTAAANVGVNGLPDTPILVSGGWDVTNMSTQEGFSFWDENQGGTYFQLNAFNILERVGFYRSGYSDGNIGVVYFADNYSTFRDSYLGCNYLGIVAAYAVKRATMQRIRQANIYGTHFFARQRAQYVRLDRCEFVGSEAGEGFYMEPNRQSGGSNDNREQGDNFYISNCNLGNNSAGGVNVALVPQTRSLITYTRMTDGGVPAIRQVRGVVKARDCLLDASNPVSFSGHLTGAKLQLHNLNQIPGNHITYFDGYATFNSEMSTNRRTSTGLAWALRPLDSVFYVNQYAPVRVPVAQVFVEAGKQITASVFMKRTDTFLTAGLVMREGQLTGQNKVQTAMTAAAGTWQQVQISFLAAASGVVEIEAFAYGSAIGTVYLDDFTITSTTPEA